MSLSIYVVYWLWVRLIQEMPQPTPSCSQSVDNCVLILRQVDQNFLWGLPELGLTPDHWVKYDSQIPQFESKYKILVLITTFEKEQGKSEGFESCDRPIVRKHPIWVKIDDVLSRVTLKFDGWPWKTIGHLSFAVSSFVQHFIAIGEFKLELQSGNAQFGSNSTILRAVWPWNFTYDLEKQ